MTIPKLINIIKMLLSGGVAWKMGYPDGLLGWLEELPIRCVAQKMVCLEDELTGRWFNRRWLARKMDYPEDWLT